MLADGRELVRKVATMPRCAGTASSGLEGLFAWTDWQRGMQRARLHGETRDGATARRRLETIDDLSAVRWESDRYQLRGVRVTPRGMGSVISRSPLSELAYRRRAQSDMLSLAPTASRMGHSRR